MGTLFHPVLAGKDRHIFQGRGIRQLRPLRGDVIALQGVLLPGFLPGRGLLGFGGFRGLGFFPRLRGLGGLRRFCGFRGFCGLGRFRDFRGFRGFRGLGRLGFFRRLRDFRRLCDFGRLRLLQGVHLILAVFGPACRHGVAQGHIPLIQKVHQNVVVLRQIAAERQGQVSVWLIQVPLAVSGTHQLFVPVIGRRHKVVALSGGKGPVRNPVVDAYRCLVPYLLHLGGQAVCVPSVCGAHHRDHRQHHGQHQQQTEKSSLHGCVPPLIGLHSNSYLGTSIIPGVIRSVNPPFFSYFPGIAVPLPRHAG